jgi:glyoxylase-like metal-dependent hydrolase (beta-lactamase superfamily II)
VQPRGSGTELEPRLDAERVGCCCRTPSTFPGGVGNTFKKDELSRQLIGDVESKIFDRLPDETWIYPGHGDDTTVGIERPHLPEWHARGW